MERKKLGLQLSLRKGFFVRLEGRKVSCMLRLHPLVRLRMDGDERVLGDHVDGDLTRPRLLGAVAGMGSRPGCRGVVDGAEPLGKALHRWGERVVGGGHVRPACVSSHGGDGLGPQDRDGRRVQRRRDVRVPGVDDTFRVSDAGCWLRPNREGSHQPLYGACSCRGRGVLGLLGSRSRPLALRAKISLRERKGELKQERERAQEQPLTGGPARARD